MKGAHLVWLKEIAEFLRDRRVLMGAFVVPIIFIFAFTSATAGLEKSFSREAGFQLTMVGDDSSPIIAEARKRGKARIMIRATLGRALQDLEKGRTALVFVPNGAGSKVYYDSSRPLSLAGLGGLRQSVAEANREALKMLLADKGIDLDEAEPLKLEAVDYAAKEGLSGSPFASMLPYLLILWAFTGGSSVITDLIPGEKERKTLETILLAPIPRSSIFWGKFLSLFTLCLTSGLMTLVGLGLSAVTGRLGELKGLSLGLPAVLAFLAVLLPLVVLYAGMLILVGTLSRSIRESQTYIAILSFVVMTPAVMSQFIGLTGGTHETWVAWTPILNASVALGQALKNQVDFALILPSLATSLGIGGIACAIALNMFLKESILRRT